MKHPLIILACLALTVAASAAPPADVRVTPQWIQHRLSSTEWMVVEASWGPADGPYAKGHIPGAVHINTDEIEYDQFPARKTTAAKALGRSTTLEEDAAKGISPDQTLPRNFWQLYPDRYLLPALAHMGITTRSRVIVTSHDPLAAARLTWTLLYAGVADVRLLDGGAQAWTRSGYALSTQPVPRHPARTFGRDRAAHPEYKADVAQVRRRVAASPSGQILDVRTRSEFTGAWAPYDYIPTKGRIPSALWIGSGTNPWNINTYLDDEGRYRDPSTLVNAWAAKGAAKSGAVFYCGTGWRSSAAFILARAAGWQKIKNMDGGWMVWSMGGTPSPDTP